MLYVHGAGHFHPENVIDNRFLEELDIDTSDAWIVDRVGIRERRTVMSLDYIKTTRNADPAAALEASDYTNAQTGARAATAALECAGLGVDDVGLILAGSCTPQTSCPAESCTIGGELGVEVPGIDVNSACSSLAAQIYLLDQMRPEALPDYVLVINPDNSTRGINYADRDTCVLWGDGTAALVVSTKVPAPLQISHSTFTSQPSGHEKVQFLQHRHFRQDGRTVQTFAIKRTVAMIKQMRKNLTEEENARLKFIGHQANLAMLASVCKWTGIDSDNHLYNVDRFGNCGAAGGPSVLSQNFDSLVAGDVIALAVVGSGLSWGGMLLHKTREAA
ncbi:MAG: ketoacyl-ACP synthase III [Gammaproteobacteria bacterium]